MADFPLAPGLTALTIVTGISDRTARFPAPNTNQLVYDIGTLAIERWNGAAWVTDVTFVSSTVAEVFLALVTCTQGLLVSGPGTASGFADYLVLNALRQFGGAVGLSLFGANPSGAQDVRFYQDGAGNTFLSSGGVTLLEIDKSGNLIALASGTLLWPQIGGHQQVDGWSLTNVAASQTNLQMTRAVNEFIPTAPGYITGLGIKTSGSVTGANATATVFINNVASSIVAVITVGTTFGGIQYRPPTQMPSNLSTVAFAAGQTLDIRLTTPGGWTFTTGTVQATMEITT